MRKCRFSEEHIIHALMEHEQGQRRRTSAVDSGSQTRPTTDGRRSLWGPEVSDARRLKPLENAKLLWMLGQRDVDIEALRFHLRKKLRSADQRKAALSLRRVFRMRERRACHKRMKRLCNEEGLLLRKRTQKRMKGAAPGAAAACVAQLAMGDGLHVR